MVLVLVTLVSDLMSLLQHSIAVQRHISKLSISKSRLQVTKDKTLPNEADYVVIGSGIGGLSCAAMLRYYNYSVLVLESHTVPGGVAHGFEKKGFKFDAGPSLWNGMSTKPYNPLREVSKI